MKCSTVNADSVAGAIDYNNRGSSIISHGLCTSAPDGVCGGSRDFVFLKTENGKAIEDIDLQLLLMFDDR